MQSTTNITEKIILCPICRGHKNIRTIERWGPQITETEKPCNYCKALGIVYETITTIIEHEPCINIKPLEV